ncbi:MAG: DUF2207 domain-containing protein [Candidatus Saccharimonadales bacterium]
MKKELAMIRDNQAIVAQYAPPTDLTPAEVGLLYDYKFEDREITATLIDLAMRGFIAIHKVDRKHLFGEYSVYEFELLREDEGLLDLKKHEQSVLNGLFGVVNSISTARIQATVTDPQAQENIERYYAGRERVSMIGNRVSVDQLKPYFHQYISDAYADTHFQLEKAGYFKDSFSWAGGLFVLFGICLGISAQMGVFSVWLPVWVVWLCAVVMLLIASVLLALRRFARQRAPIGHKAKRYLEGFMLYLKTAEIDRLKGVQAPETIEQLSRGINLYTTYLPYAIALGLEGDWTKKFAGSYAASPTWVIGDTLTTVGDLQQSIVVALRHSV